jgi:hypothetical protein
MARTSTPATTLPSRAELPFTGLMLAYLFLVTATFWILKPLKKALFIQYYHDGVSMLGWRLTAPEAELIAKVANMVVAAIAVAVFSQLSRRLRRQALTLTFTAVFMVAFAAYTLVLPHPGDATVWSFYLFGDLFSTIMVTTFFAFLNDSVSPAASKVSTGRSCSAASRWRVRRAGSPRQSIASRPTTGSGSLRAGLAIAVIAWTAGRVREGLLRAAPSTGRAPPAGVRAIGQCRAQGARLVAGSPLPPLDRRHRRALRDRVDRDGLPVHEPGVVVLRGTRDRRASLARVRDHERGVARRAGVPDRVRHDPLRRRHGTARAPRDDLPRLGCVPGRADALDREPAQHRGQRLQLLDQPVRQGVALHADVAVGEVPGEGVHRHVCAALREDIGVVASLG